jgi:hypothetical protein
MPPTTPFHGPEQTIVFVSLRSNSQVLFALFILLSSTYSDVDMLLRSVSIKVSVHENWCGNNRPLMLSEIAKMGKAPS